jgi:exopolysaccharide biosynthesis polyprenyl glycosylphosphotransferase
MTSFKRLLLIKANNIFDIFVMVFAFAVASYITAMVNTPTVSLSEFLATRIKIQNFLIVGLLFLSWQLIFRLSGIYRSRRLGSRLQEILDLLKGTSISTSLLLVVGFTFHITLIDITFLFTFWGVSSLTLVLSRIILHSILRKARLKGHNTRQMVIIGTGKRALNFASKIHQSPELGYHIIGFVDDPWKGLDKFKENGLKLLGGLGDFQFLLNNQVIDEAVIGLPLKSHYDEISAIIKICEEQGIIVRVLSDLFDLKIAKSQVDRLDNVPILTLHSAPLDQWPLLVKRFIDLSLSIILLIFLSPIFLLIAIMVKIDSKGPVFFIQERMGLNKRKFKLLKFRTMVVNAEKLRDRLERLNEISGPVFKIRDDPRVTRIGKWLRRTSIDELPQLINVLKGDMSLVGPRPPIQSEMEQYQWKDRRRLSMKPGITCLWQINGRSNIPFDKWMELDKEYIDNWSLWLDLKILAKTIPTVIRHSGAA